VVEIPELPEVETIRRGLTKSIVGKKVLDLGTNTPKMIQPSLTVVQKAIVGEKIEKIERRAKVLQVFLSNGKILIIHLKLTGRLLVRKKGDPPDDWQRVAIFLSGEKELRFCDLRKFGWIKLITNQELKNLNQGFGPEPLDDLTIAYFEKFLSSTRRAVKIALLDQKKISGIGNIYANDALFLARLDPRRPSNSLTEPEVKKLFEAIEKVLKAGIRHRGASDQHYLDAFGRKGSYQDYFLVYGRTGKDCFGCKGKIKRIKIGGRGTFYCPECQK